MIRLVLRDLRMFFLISLPLFLVMSGYWAVTASKTSFILVILFQFLFQIALVLLPVFINENYEDVNNGYAVLKILPLKRLEIVGAKFLAPLISSTVFIILNVLLFWFYKGTVDYTDFGILAIVYGAFFTLYGSALIYIIGWKIGYTNLIQFFSVIIVAVSFLFVFALKLFKINTNELGPVILNVLQSLNNIFGVLLGLLFYFLLFLVARLVEQK